MRNFLIFCFLFGFQSLTAREDFEKFKHVLYINSYGISYSWGDSITKGVIETFAKRKDIILYVEHIDAKRFGNTNNELNSRLFKSKYKQVQLEAVILSDNDALDFFMKYGDEFASNVPVYFCGINNPEDYNLENSKYFGIKEGVDLDSVCHMITEIMPRAKNLYFFADSTTTSIININYLRKIEPKYKNRIKFQYVVNVSIDSLKRLAPTLHRDDAIGLVDIFQDKDKTAVNSDVVLQDLAQISSVPIFMDAMPSLGKGLCGGIINNGTIQGVEVAKLALKFIDDPSFVPPSRIIVLPDQYYFDFNVLTKYNIDKSLLPKGSILINLPESNFREYVRYTVALIFIVVFLISIIVLLFFNIRRRKEAEETVKQKLIEIQDQYTRLEETTQLVNEMNTRLEAVNNDLKETNHALIKEKIKSEESDRLKSAFLANMSHEIRTPLNAIVGFSQLLCNEDNDRKQSDYFRIISSNSETLLVLINDILDISLIESNQLKINEEIFDPSSILKELELIFKIKKQNGLDIKFINDYTSSIFVNTDPVRFRQIITNLLENATKFTENGYVHFGYLVEGNFVTFYVKDTGIGIASENFEKIFNYFHKLEEGTQKLYRGTGIGLSLCKKLTNLMKGKIWVESELGKGATFYLTLPIFEKVTKNKHEEPQIQIAGPGKIAKQIIIAEDEETNYLLLDRYFMLMDIPLIFRAKNGRELVDYVKSNPGQISDCIILMDIKMPIMNGIEALHEVRKISPNTIVIALTAYATELEKENILKQGFDGYLSKPISKDDLKLAIEKFC